MVSLRELAPPARQTAIVRFPAMESVMTSQIRTAIDFYDQHPISAGIILAKLEAARGTLEGLQPDDLFPHDQDHYGGLAANDALARAARIGLGSKGVDLFAGPGGAGGSLPHRFWAAVTRLQRAPARVGGRPEPSAGRRAT